MTKKVHYTYDVNDLRIGKQVDSNGDGTWDRSERYAYDGANIVLVFNGSGVVTNRYLQTAGMDGTLAEETPGQLTRWLLPDYQGTIRDVVDTGSGQSHFTYDSFGQILSSSGSLPAPRFSYTGREWDGDAGLFYYRARWYDASTGRFISQDPIGFAAGDGNLYRYVGNGPTNAVDPWGLWSWSETGAWLVGFGEGAVQGVKNVGIGVYNTGKEIGLQAVDLVNDTMAVTTGTTMYNGHLSNLGTASTQADFNYGQHVAETGANVVTLGVYGEVKLTYQYATDQIDLQTYSQNMGAAGVMQLGQAYAMSKAAPVNVEGTNLVGHGGAAKGTTVIPEGTTLRLFSEEGQPITQGMADQIVSGRVNPKQSPEVYGPGDPVPNYTLHPETPGVTYPSETIGVPPGSGGLPLSEILGPNMGPMNWAACRPPTQLPPVRPLPPWTLLNMLGYHGVTAANPGVVGVGITGHPKKK